MKSKPDYGLDAPGVFRGLLSGGLTAVGIGIFFSLWLSAAIPVQLPALLLLS